MSQKTREALMKAAERLIAEKGLGGVSVKEITRASGAKNESALHYHFGSVLGLMTEVFAARFNDIETARMEGLLRLEGQREKGDIMPLLHAAIAPYLATCLEQDGRLYASFCAQLAAHPKFDILEIARNSEMPSAAVLRQHLQSELAFLPDDILETRLRRGFLISLSIAADYAAQIEKNEALPLELATAEAAQTLAAFICAPAPQTAD